MDFAAAPASSYGSSQLTALLNQGFEEYIIPIQFTNAMFLNMLQRDGIDLSASRVLLADDTPCGIALIAPRRARQASRLAAMGIAREARGQGAGSWLMQRLIDEADRRSEREMVLEVIEQNEPAVRLYQKYGFEPVRRLVGFVCRKTQNDTAADLHPVDLGEIHPLIDRHGLPDMPWQLSGQSLAQMQPPAHAYRSGPAYVVMTDPQAQHIVIWSLLVEPRARGKRMGTKILRQVMANHPGKTWHVPAICPEEFGPVFERAGFERETLSQWQMRLAL